jgi:uncharacterized iron-regulated membrane protein
VLIPVATSSGEALEHRVGNPGEHAELGDQLIWFAIPLLVMSAALVWLDRRARASGHDQVGRVDTPADPQRRTLTMAVAVLAAIASLATSVQVYRVGDSGARAAWGDRVSAGS